MYVYTEDAYACCVHFDGSGGPAKEGPDPVCAIASTEKVKCTPRKAKLSQKLRRTESICLLLG